MDTMDTRKAYNIWASQYDTNSNKTRDLEGEALRSTLSSIPFEHCLEVGCGTGKNTTWLVGKAKQVTAIDLSEEMLAKAKEKVSSNNVKFKQIDITTDWAFTKELYDLISFSLVLEHMKDLSHIFSQASKFLKTGGYVYIGELHPFKQYSGTKARFDTVAGRQVLECFNHHITDFTEAGKKHRLVLRDIGEYFDDNDRNRIPRILTLMLQKS